MTNEATPEPPGPGDLPVVLGEAIAAYHPPRSYDPDDITTWPADQLNELAAFVYAGVDGVELVADYVVDDLPEHGVNIQADKP